MTRGRRRLAARLVAGALAVLGAGGDPGAGGWIAFRSASARFAIALPGPPVEARSGSATAAGRVRTWEFTSRAGAAEFWVEVHELPAVASWLMSDAALLERAERDFASDEGASDLTSEAVDIAGHPGRRLAYAAGAGQAGRARLVLVDRRLYLLAALFPASDPAEAELARFFGSFEVW